MVISLSVVVLLLVFAWIFLRGGGPRLKFSHALVCVLLGFCLASSSMAATIHDGLTATANAVSSLRP